MQHLVVNRPEAVEVQHLLVPGSGGLHLAIRLVTDAVVDEQKLRLRHQLVDGLLHGVRAKVRQELALVVRPLDESVRRVTIGFHGSHHNTTVVILLDVWLMNRHGTSVDGLLEDAGSIIDRECDVLHAISVLSVVSVELFVALRVERRSESKLDLAIVDDVRGVLAIARLKALVGQELEAELASVVSSCLLGVAYPEGNVVEAVEGADSGALCGFFVVYHKIII